MPASPLQRTGATPVFESLAVRADARAARDAMATLPGEWRLHALSEALGECAGPYVAVTDFMKAVPDQVARWIPGSFTTLGTDGYGRSDSRAALRRHFETDAAHVVVAVLSSLAQLENGKPEEVEDAIARYGLDADAVEPRLA